MALRADAPPEPGKGYRYPSPKCKVFLAWLRKSGAIGPSAKAAGVHRRTVYRWKDADAVFAAQWKEAIDDAFDAMELECVRRGTHGVAEDVYYRGEVVGQVRKYSDVLLMFMLNGGRPEKYRPRPAAVEIQAGADQAAPTRIVVLPSNERFDVDDVLQLTGENPGDKAEVKKPN